MTYFSSSSSRLLLCTIFISLVGVAIAQPDFLHNLCINNGNYTNNTTYQTNLQTVLSTISSNTQIDYGFYNFSAGQNSDRVDAVALCRGDVALDNCRSCVNDSSHKLTQVCPNYKEAIGWYDNCMLRYSTGSNMFGATESVLSFHVANPNNALSQFNSAFGVLMANLRRQAASGDARRKFAAGKMEATSSQSVYGLVQCTPDLSELECGTCLDGTLTDIRNCCDGKEGGRFFRPSCDIRFETFQFYESTATAMQPPPPSTPPPTPSTNTTGGGKSNNTSRTIIIIVVVSAVAAVILIVCICIFLRIRKKMETMNEIITVESLQLDFSTIRIATDNFSDANKLGQGGFGAVYKGKLSNGQDVAVKRLSKDSGQGDQEFKNEVMLVAKLQHRNLVRLLGFCLEGSERLLVYEFVPNTSLDHFLFDRIKRACLDWEIRSKIIGGIARGLLYLHEDSHLRIIHRDLKASNILLDAEMIPKVADFGVARLFVMDETQGFTSRIVGTYGYMAPEYALHGNFSVKSDVYSFGVLVLEIVSGRKNTYFPNGENVEHLISCAWENWRDGTALDLVDPTLRGGSSSEIMRCIHIGLLCVQENISDRPTMASVALMLNSYSLTLPVPTQPAFFRHGGQDSEMPLLIENNSGTTESDKSHYISARFSTNEASITDL